MPTVTVSDKGQVVIPVEIRRRLGITPGCQLDFSLDGHVIHAEVKLASSHCTEFISFDDRRFARRANRLGVTPAVVVPAR